MIRIGKALLASILLSALALAPVSSARPLQIPVYCCPVG